jgi:hypothetical protein
MSILALLLAPALLYFSLSFKGTARKWMKIGGIVISVLNAGAGSALASDSIVLAAIIIGYSVFTWWLFLQREKRINTENGDTPEPVFSFNNTKKVTDNSSKSSTNKHWLDPILNSQMGTTKQAEHTKAEPKKAQHKQLKWRTAYIWLWAGLLVTPFLQMRNGNPPEYALLLASSLAIQVHIFIVFPIWAIRTYLKRKNP